MSEINPCPICKGEVNAVSWMVDISMYCDVCDMHFYFGASFTSVEKVTKKWNKLVPARESVTWKKDFAEYKKMAEAARIELLADGKFMDILSQVLDSRCDVVASLNKSFNVFWSTEDGWKNKKRRRNKGIDWRSTIRKTIYTSRVFIPWDQQKNNSNNNEDHGLVM